MILRVALAFLAGTAAGMVLVWGTVALTVVPRVTGPSPSAVVLQAVGLVLAVGGTFGIAWEISRNRWAVGLAVLAVAAFACTMFATAY